MGGIGIWQLVIVLLIVFLLFGTSASRALVAMWARRSRVFASPWAATLTPNAPGQAQVQQQAPLTGQATQQPQADRQA